jgi:hypothetical protein
METRVDLDADALSHVCLPGGLRNYTEEAAPDGAASSEVHYALLSSRSAAVSTPARFLCARS